MLLNDLTFYITGKHQSAIVSFRQIKKKKKKRKTKTEIREKQACAAKSQNYLCSFALSVFRSYHS